MLLKLTFEQLCSFSECLRRVTLVPECQPSERGKKNPKPETKHRGENESGPRLPPLCAPGVCEGLSSVPTAVPCCPLTDTQNSSFQRTGGPVFDVSRPINGTPFLQQRGLAPSRSLSTFAARTLRANSVLDFLTCVTSRSG